MSIILLNKRNTEHSGVIREKRTKRNKNTDYRLRYTSMLRRLFAGSVRNWCRAALHAAITFSEFSQYLATLWIRT